MHKIFIEEGFEFIDDIIWQKPVGAGWASGRGRRFSADRNAMQYKGVPVTEYVMVYRKKSDKLIENTYYGSDGSTTTKIGNTYYGSGGSTTTKIGNTYYGSGGSTTTKIGNTYYGSDGSTTTKIGDTYYHNGR